MTDPLFAVRARRGRRLAVGALALVVALAAGREAAAQSCILTRLDSPVLHSFDPTFDAAVAGKRWQITAGWRYGKSDRHFVGTVEQVHRKREGSQVINTVHLLDLELLYQLSPRSSLAVGFPYLMATRSGPVRDEDRNLVGRETRETPRGIGDIAFTFHHLVWDPTAHPRQNLSLGVGIEIPTGNDSVIGTRTRVVDGETTVSFATADESVQPGDGGFGLILQASGYRLLNAADTLAAYATGTYIVAPEGTNGVKTFRSAPGEEVVSIADQYVARAGLQLGPQRWRGWSVGLGGRIEGIPVHDLIGPSTGFRRPGYMVSVEPTVSWVHGVHSVNLSLPVAVQRNRQTSVPDRARGAHGDAAFPDYLVLASYSRRF